MIRTVAVGTLVLLLEVVDVRGFAQATTPRVCCLGEALFDCIATETSHAERPAEELEASGAFRKLPGGAPANAATALVRLGTPAAFLGAIGNDDHGEELLKLFGERDVDVSGVEIPERCTRRVMVNVDENGERHFAGFGKRKTECFADEGPTPSLRPEAEATLREANVLLTGTLGLAFDDMRSLMHNAASIAREQGQTVMVDVNWRPVFWGPDEERARRLILESLREKATLIKITDEEAEWLFPGKVDASTIMTKPELLLEEDFFPGLDMVLVTGGTDGSSIATKEGRKHRRDAFRVKTIETTGAGDGFSAGFIHHMLESAGKELDLDEALKFASAVGALVTTKYGAWSQPHLDEVLSLCG